MPPAHITPLPLSCTFIQGTYERAAGLKLEGGGFKCWLLFSGKLAQVSTNVDFSLQQYPPYLFLRTIRLLLTHRYS